MRTLCRQTIRESCPLRVVTGSRERGNPRLLYIDPIDAEISAQSKAIGQPLRAPSHFSYLYSARALELLPLLPRRERELFVAREQRERVTHRFHARLTADK